MSKCRAEMLFSELFGQIALESMLLSDSGKSENEIKEKENAQMLSTFGVSPAAYSCSMTKRWSKRLQS